MPNQITCLRCRHSFRTIEDYDAEDPLQAVQMFAQCPICNSVSPSSPVESSASYHFKALGALSRSYAKSIPSDGPFAIPGQAFRQNLHRVFATAIAPEMFAAQYMFCREKLPVGAITTTGPMLSAEAIAQMRQVAAQEFRWDFSGTDVDGWFGGAHSVASKLAFESLIGSILIGTWTAFETLAGDLWVTALNENPRLGVRALGAEPKPGDDNNERRRTTRIKQALPIQRLQRYDYNLKHALGDLLREKWDFGRRDETRDAYKAAFGLTPEDASELDNIFDNIELRWLAAMRNALVHRGGIADEQFLSLVETHPTWGKTEVGKPITINGLLAAPLVENAIGRGLKLLAFVHARIFT